MAATGKNYVVDDFTAVYTTAAHAPGTVVESEGYEYRFIQNGDTDTATAGNPLSMEDASTNKWVGCYDLSDGLDGVILGVPMADLATGEYGWVMKEGIYDTCSVGGAVTIGNELVAKTTDAVFRAETAGDIVMVCGVALEAATAAATSISVWIKGV